MSKTSRRTRCEAVAREIEIPRPFDLDAFCTRLAARRGRPLRLVPLEGVPDAATPCGVWVATRNADLIFYEPATSSVHKLQIVLHEVAHVLLGHGAPDRERPGYVSRLLSSDRQARAADTRREEREGCQGVEQPEGSEGHDGPRGAEASPAAEGFADLDDLDELDMDQLLHILGRTSYTDAQERDAELLATILSDRALSEHAPAASDSRASRVLGRLNDAFGHPVRG